MRRIETVAIGTGRTRISVGLHEIGPDLLAVIEGDGEHIGAVTLAEGGREGLRAETLSAVGHRESELTPEFGRALSAATGRRVVAVAGIHLDDITKDEIEAIRRNVAESVPVLASVVRTTP